jgi:acylphosphatase
MAGETGALHVWVRGRVQGVGFRAFTRARAEELGLRGWVRNLADDRVEAWATGDADALDAWRQAVERGPRFAAVEDVEVAAESVEGAAGQGGFRVLR